MRLPLHFILPAALLSFVPAWSMDLKPGQQGVAIDAGTVSFSPPASQQGIFHQVDWSRNLSSWTTLAGIRSGSSLELTIPTAGEPAVFLRQQVEVNE